MTAETLSDEQAAGAPPPLAAFLRPELPPAALYGLPGEVATTLAETTGADPAAILLTFLTLLGNAAGPQPHARFGGAEHPSRLFTVLVGDAATGRKGTALAAVEPLFAEADPDWAESRVLYGLQSGEAMIDQVADGYAKDCRLLVVETEFARLAVTMARTGTLSAHLRNAWDGRTLQRVGTRHTQQASRAHISLLAMITPEELLRHHTRLSQAGGLESRILYVYTAPLAEVSPFAAGADAGDLAERLRMVLEECREAVMNTTDPVSRHLLLARGIQPKTEYPVAGEVAGRWREVKRRLPKPGHGLASLHSRAESQVIRLAAAYALADHATQIGMGHVEPALAAWAYCARSAEVVFGVPVAALPPKIDPRIAAKVVRHLHERWPEWVPCDEIGSEVLHGNIPATQIAAVLDDLATKRLIVQQKMPAGGREEYRLAGQIPLFP